MGSRAGFGPGALTHELSALALAPGQLVERGLLPCSAPFARSRIGRLGFVGVARRHSESVPPPCQTWLNVCSYYRYLLQCGPETGVVSVINRTVWR